jgi:hypothetical protein
VRAKITKRLSKTFKLAPILGMLSTRDSFLFNNEYEQWEDYQITLSIHDNNTKNEQVREKAVTKIIFGL